MVDNVKTTSLSQALALLFENNQFQEIIKLLESTEDLSYDDKLSLVRAYINEANVSLDDTLYDKASDILDSVSLKGKDDALWQFYKGYVLFKEGLYQDALIRVERGLSFVSISDNTLFDRLNTLKNRIISLEARSKPFSGSFKQEFGAFFEKNYGQIVNVISASDFDLLVVKENDNTVLLQTLGLSRKIMQVPSDSDAKTNERLELCMQFKAKNGDIDSHSLSFAVNLLSALSAYFFDNEFFMGFGFTLDGFSFDKPYDNYKGFMLMALGHKAIELQSVDIEDKHINLFMICPLYDEELRYREHHSAKELIEVFKLRQVAPCPINDKRVNVLK